MKKIVLILAAASFVGCASLPPQEYYGAEDPFSQQLDYYYVEKEKGRNWLQNSAIAVVAGIAGASIARTGISSGWWGEEAGNAVVVLGSTVVVGAAATGYIGYRKWDENSDYYIDTLRLQSQYYNSPYTD